MSRETMPRISVVIPTYNRAAYLAGAIESALGQDCGDTEILVVDDGSRDASREVVAPYADSGRVRYVWQENAGVSAARNRGIREARGEFVAFLDSDDAWLPGHLRRLSRALVAHHEARIAFSNFVFTGYGDVQEFSNAFGASVHRLLSGSFARAADGVWVSRAGLLAGLLDIGFPFRIQGSMVYRGFLLEHDLWFDEAMSFTEEAQFVVEAACHTPILFVEEPGVAISRHGDNTDESYGPKITRSYERRIRRLKELFPGGLSREERRALKGLLLRMQTHIMNDRTRGRQLPARIREAARLLIEVPSYASLKAVAKMLVRRRTRRPAGAQLERA